ncbi:receptor-interacting serine/threonine-protein kinase 3-like [Micropterus salmoides]|uniref:receptor-interacting serine/threonine-protein kinase 3-like n=1 Tax=Micropterus salmoides TaxID=27706 RepID=UPI0018EAD67C|nr:receptor-interacting serine/threonine-protein kinase 3-like [Micropterus salmoides]XP_038562822.1 receptor-interacting serine/threonine-protein kinase 3-like [Micropterus salmoides]XP_038562823.1 receptor-interacting serine/threonine-protein kinase 3-like [Micropterus salmoides]
MALLSRNTEPIGNERLEKWVSVDSGGFGHVYKARHKELCIDVAIKILRDDVRPALYEEAKNMEKASCPFVLTLYGMYQGCPPFGGTSMQQGIVMEFMERGSVHSLLKDLSGPPPWPLAFRLAHQVGLGMNFLHSMDLMHQDLKPSNVLLDDNLNAKLADFGLCRVSTSALNSSREATGAIGGSHKYMPPEAFEASYKPTRAFDIYSYGILLWCIVTGKEPYPMADYSLVALGIPRGDRPPCDKIKQMNVEGLKQLVDLMQRCWVQNPSERPPFKECLKVTENLLSMHKKGIPNAFLEVSTRLSPTSNQHSNCFPHPTPEQTQANDTVDHVRFTKMKVIPSSMQDSVSTKIISNAEKAKFVDDKRAALIQKVSEVMAVAEDLGNMVHPEAYAVIDAKGTSQEKMRVLYQRVLTSGGEKVKAAFYDALRNHHPALMDSD